MAQRIEKLGKLEFGEITQVKTVHKAKILPTKVTFHKQSTFGLKEKDDRKYFMVMLDEASLIGIERLNKNVKTWLAENHTTLPKPFRKMSKDEMLNCYQPLESPAKDDYKPVLFAQVNQYKGKISSKLSTTELAQRGTVSFTLNLKSVLFIPDKSKIKIESDLYELRYDTVAQDVSYLNDD